MKGFTKFVREQGVVGLAVGFILGGALNSFVSDFVTGIVNPLLSAAFSVESLAREVATVNGSTVYWGGVLSSLINFVVIAAVVYFGVKGLGLDKLDKKK